MMSKTTAIELMKARINLLHQRDPVANVNIINKLKRKIRMYSKE